MSDFPDNDRYESEPKSQKSPIDNDRYDADYVDPLKGKSTLGKPMTPIARPPKSGWTVASWVLLGLFFGFSVLMFIIVIINRTLFKPGFACALFAFASLLAGAVCRVLNNRRYCHHHTVGRIIDIRRQINFRAPPIYMPRVEYTVEGLTYHVWGPGSYRSPAFHAEMNVYYDPANPQNATCRIGKRSTAIIWTVIALLLMIGGVILLCV